MSSAGTRNRKASQSRRRRRRGLATTGLPISARRTEWLLIGVTPIAALSWPSPFRHKASKGDPLVASVRRGGGHKGEAAGAMLLRLGCAITQAPEPMEADGAGQGVSRLALVQLRGCLPAQLRIFQPVEREQGGLDAADFAQRCRAGLIELGLPINVTLGGALGLLLDLASGADRSLSDAPLVKTNPAPPLSDATFTSP